MTITLIFRPSFADAFRATNSQISGLLIISMVNLLVHDKVNVLPWRIPLTGESCVVVKKPDAGVFISARTAAAISDQNPTGASFTGSGITSGCCCTLTGSADCSVQLSFCRSPVFSLSLKIGCTTKLPVASCS
jgi:hypothetical protein